MPDVTSAEHTSTPGAVAYVLKGFPRLSEIFIASEIYRLEQAGLRLRLFVIKPGQEGMRHEVVDRIRSETVYLPRATSVSGTTLLRWLAGNLGRFLPGLLRSGAARPLGFVRAMLAAFAQAVRARRTFWSWPRKVYLKEFLQAAALADRLLHAKDVRHLHAHFCHGATTVTWLAAIITGIPFSFTAHAKDIYCESLNPAGLLPRKMAAARFVVTCTEANRQYLQQIAPETRVHCIYHGLNADFARLLEQQPEKPATNGHLHLLAVGRLVPKKGFDTFVEACAILRKSGVPFEARIVGESGEHEEEIRRRIAAHGLAPCIHLTGPLSQAELYREYRLANLFCLPCRVLENGDRDGLPNVLVEAMACGLPIISTEVSGIPEAVENESNGVLVPPENPEELANAMLRMARDKSFAQRLAQAGQVTIRQRFDGERLAAELAGLFREAV